MEERKRKGRGGLFVVFWISHSGIIKNQERKEICPGWGIGVRAQRTPHPAGCCPPISSGLSLLPQPMEPLALLFLAAWCSDPSSQFPPHACSTSHSLTVCVIIPALPSHPHPQPARGS